MNNIIYACYATSDFYARETGISMIGFFENNPDYEPDVFFILDYGLLSNNKDFLNEIANKYSKRIEYLPAKQILENIQKELDLKDFRGSLATYSRAFIDKILPDYVDLLFYIDSDTVVTGSIKELKNLEMKRECMAGVYSPVFSKQIIDKKLVLYSNNQHYYGCGIVFFNLKNWRRNNCYDNIVRMLSIKKELPCADQTLINNALEEKCFKKLPLKFNYTTHLFSDKYEIEFLRKTQLYDEEEIIDAIHNPIVVHYPGRPIDRPWFKKCTSRRKAYYLKYKAMSPWKDNVLIENPARDTGFRSFFNTLIHSMETNSSLFASLQIINRIRSFGGPILRFLKIYSNLPQEGIEI